MHALGLHQFVSVVVVVVCSVAVHGQLAAGTNKKNLHLLNG